MKAVETVKKEKIDFLLAVGGGSVMDGTKFISMASKYEGNPEELLKQGFKSAPVKEALPLGVVVTLPATGSEMNSGAVISYGDGKYPVFSPFVFPKFSFLDPTLTFLLPGHQVANGIVDTFIHVVEQYVTFPAEGRLQDRISEGILQTLIEIGETTINEPENYDARASLMWCAAMGLNGLVAAGVPQDWTTHMIGHELTAMFGIDHGKTLAVIQPGVWKIRKDKKREKFIQYAERVWKIKEKNDDKKINSAIEKTEEFFEKLGLSTRLSNYGVKKEDLENIIKGLEKRGLTALSETGDLDLETSMKILEISF